MQDSEHRQLAAGVLPIVLSAGAVVMSYFQSSTAVETKADASPVTAADREAEELIAAGLARLQPDIPVIGEEAASLGKLPKAASRFFLVDPLDGTRDFIAGRKEFTVNVALVEDREPVFGVVYQPATSRFFTTITDHHALEATVAPGSGIDSLDALGGERIRTRSPDPDDLVVAVSHSHHTGALDDRLSQLGIRRRVSVGSSLKFCLVARGEADVYPRQISISEWDTAAGHAIVTAAGGAVLTLDGAPLTYGNADCGYRIAPFVAWGAPELAAKYSFA
ncbi:MAG: 3'(2'),5'-bisphosphate nucleotidase CysQ [Hyphomicrobiaceae bacterium]